MRLERSLVDANLHSIFAQKYFDKLRISISNRNNSEGRRRVKLFEQYQGNEKIAGYRGTRRFDSFRENFSLRRNAGSHNRIATDLPLVTYIVPTSCTRQGRSMKHSVTKCNTHDAFRVRDERALAAAAMTISVSDSDAEAEAAPRRDAMRLRRRSNAAGKLSATVPAQFMIFNWWCCKELINATLNLSSRIYPFVILYRRYCYMYYTGTPVTIASQLLTIANNWSALIYFNFIFF